MGYGIIHWNPGFCKEGVGGFVGFQAPSHEIQAKT